MSKCILFVIGMFSLHVQALGIESDPLYFDIHDPVIHELVEWDAGPAAAQDTSCEASQFFSPLNIGWDEIVRVGRELWQIIVDNKPVLHSQAPVAHALPRGLNCWMDLERWSPPQTKTYQVVYENKLGIEAVKFRFRVQYTAGGRGNGRGRYIANATILNSQTDVILGFTFNSHVQVPRTVNVGTRRDPVAGLEMNLHWNVKTIVKESDNSVQFFIDGNGGLTMAE